jgi:hypothetical protein
LNPKRPDYERLRARAQGATIPPEPAGRTLFEADRLDGDERLRVSLEEFNGYPFVRVAVWVRNERGAWWPAKNRNVSLKRREVAGIAEALAGVVDQLGLPPDQPPAPPADDRPEFIDKRRQRGRLDPDTLPPAVTGPTAPFDESDRP